MKNCQQTMSKWFQRIDECMKLTYTQYEHIEKQPIHTSQGVKHRKREKEKKRTNQIDACVFFDAKRRVREREGEKKNITNKSRKIAFASSKSTEDVQTHYQQKKSAR